MMKELQSLALDVELVEEGAEAVDAAAPTAEDGVPAGDAASNGVAAGAAPAA
jgi:hypothetical protein